jgi:DNA-binding NarL/FixJ family response regulator
MVRAVVADSDAVARAGTRSVLEAGGFAVVGEAGSGPASVEAARSMEPDLVVIDPFEMDGGIGAMSTLGSACQAAALVVFTAACDRAHVLAAVEAGASGYLLKEHGGEQLVAAVHHIAAGGVTFDTQVTAQLVAAGERPREARALTRRELEVVALAASGLGNEEIAERLGISEATVKKHLGSARRTIGVKRRARAAVWMSGHAQSAPGPPQCAWPPVDGPVVAPSQPAHG